MTFVVCEWRALSEQPAAEARHLRPVQYPQRQVYQMNPQIHQTTAARELAIVKPGFVGTIGIMEREIGGIDLAEIARGTDLAHLANGFNEAVREVDSEQAVALSSELNRGL